MEPLKVCQALIRDLKPLQFEPPVACVYNPLVYAWEMHRQYIERYGTERREILLLGMNPGPWGMAQTGVPFGEVNLVRDWMGLSAPVAKPRPEHPKRPVAGLSCRRSEVSGARLWGWARDIFKTPNHFFARFLVINYCPLMFMKATGGNLTPNNLPARERGPLETACDHALRSLVQYYRPRLVIGIGNFAEGRARQALSGLKIEVAYLLHPSPANPQANRGWSSIATQTLRSLAAL